MSHSFGEQMPIDNCSKLRIDGANDLVLLRQIEQFAAYSAYLASSIEYCKDKAAIAVRSGYSSKASEVFLNCNNLRNVVIVISRPSTDNPSSYVHIAVPCSFISIDHVTRSSDYLSPSAPSNLIQATLPKDSISEGDSGAPLLLIVKENEYVVLGFLHGKYETSALGKRKSLSAS